MKKLNAFVGHSFSPEDEQLVGQFLEYFDQVKGSVGGFTWTNAKKAAPTELGEKVRKLFEGKNLFIGICTKKEIAISVRSPKPVWWNRNSSSVKNDEMEVKSSDWVIQEIGYALGRKMNIVLFLEKGVRVPGKLQGDLNYIGFDRHTPSDCFGQFLEMITNMRPPPQSGGESTTLRDSPAEDDERQDEEEADKYLNEPSEDWDFARYKLALAVAIIEDDSETEERIDTAFRQSMFANESSNREQWDVYGIYARVRRRSGATLGELEDAVASYENNEQAQKYLALAYDHFGKFDESAECFKKSAELAANPESKIRDLGAYAIALAKGNRRDELFGVIDEIRDEAEQISDGQALFAAELRKIFDELDEVELWLGVMEHHLQLSPDAESDRFDLAHKLADIGLQALSLQHYQSIPFAARDGAEWNNLGVQYSKAGLAAKSISAYRKADEKGNTLASSNIAFNLIHAGFLDEAKQICDRAYQHEQPDKQVIQAMARIDEVPDEEDAKLKERLKDIEKFRKYWEDFGAAILDRLPNSVDGNWSTSRGKLVAKTKGSKFAAVETYEVAGGLLGNALTGLAGAHKSGKRKFRLIYEGHLYGRVVGGKCKREQVGGAKPIRTILGEGRDDSWTCLMNVQRNGDQIEVCVKPLSENASLETFVRDVEEPEALEEDRTDE